jgi:uncharacterized protein with FMN-binding domain
MRRSFLGRAIPAALTIFSVAVPSLTAADILLHASTSGTSAESALPASSSSNGVASASPGATATPPAGTQPAATVSTRTVAGTAVDDQFGQVQATITVSGNTITDVSITAPQDDPKSAAINQSAVPQLRTETLQAQSANVSVISGATITSDAYIQSLQNALQTAGL